jgi:cystathionine gamma-lyase
MKLPDNAAFATRCIHAGQVPDPTTGAIMTPIYQTSTFVQDGPGVHKGYVYARGSNPTRDAAQRNLAALEGAAHGVCFSSGCAAEAAIAMCLEAGDHIVCTDDVYGGTFRLFDKIFRRFGLSTSYVDMTRPDDVRAAITDKTKLMWVETPTNPMLKLIDIRAMVDIAKEFTGQGIAVVIDNTFATPYLQQPLSLGADMVLHSTTKYLGGHSDVIGGAVLTSSDDWHKRLAFVQNAAGGVPGPMDSFLLLRSTKTLHVRMQRHVENAVTIANLLANHPNVEKVYYPGLESHPQHALMKRQMRGPGAMISFVVKGGLEKATRLLKATRLFACAESLGGVESLIEHPAIMTHASVPREQREALGIDDGLIRVSVGIEDIEDLCADLRAALDA